MSSQGPDHVAEAASETHPGFENAIVDTTTGQDVHIQEPEAQRHERSVSGSGSIYYDTSEVGEVSYGLSNETASTSPPTTSSRQGGAKLKGKETNNGELEESRNAIPVDDTMVYRPRDLSEEVQFGGESNDTDSTAHQYTRIGRAMGPPGSGNRYPGYYRGPGVQTTTNPNGNPARDPRPMISLTRPQESNPSGVEGNTEEDRRNWGRIQAIGGNPLLTQHGTVPVYPPPGQELAHKSAGQSQKRKQRSSDDNHGLDGSGTNTLSGSPARLRLSVDDGSSSSDANTPLLSHTSPSQTRQREERRARSEVIVPRWQPDAEVTICPICGTQFSFFVRKHHCRKCGRVVCNACSPHRITIPYQFIVQPPTGSETSNAPSSRTRRPTLDPARAGSSSEFESLGGGERVRLCNPCVPDPNTAPPQTPSPLLNRIPQSSPRSTHNRSSSTAATYTSSTGSLGSSAPSERTDSPYMNRRIRQNFPESRGILGRQPRNSPPQTRDQPYPNYSIHLSTGDNNGSPDQAQRDPRIRASTVSHSTNRPGQNPQRETVPGMPAGLPRILPSSRDQADLRSHVPRTDQQSRPLPRPPRPHRIAEEDECPVCHQELPPSQLPNSEELRAAHITNCIETAMQGTTSTPSPPPQNSATSSFVPSSVRISHAPSSSTSVLPISAPIANTPEARMAAREQAHAAVVLGQRSSPSPAFRPTGVFPYKATEKDCVDDAECTICLEEFEVGQDMGRLECFCRFHLHCIREWFVNHYGQCPVHHQAY